MSSSKRRYRKSSERRIYIRSERHDPPDTFLLARALLDLAAEMADAAAKPSKSQAVPVEETSKGKSQKGIRP
ncbi:hypothetical protein H0264_35595 [Nocardia huaxiensis]|uniref:Uncharacterized protein n=1 Tax=Nocardia huaxiensis TaxID=2755382 RepID=A0A7D6VIK6_9NOCA|nr:hypothetical protein [Nocardia huaxiensis]QLY30390.1 hypothetical protein H0264_35595 [Nocardia huaxiensis]